MALPAPADGAVPGFYGVYPAIVTDLVDPDRLGRVQVRFPWLGSEGNDDLRCWATMCSPYADGDQGLAILPERDSQVVVAFEAGNLRRPYVIGAAWNGTAPLPHEPERSNNIRMLRTRSDSRLEFDDTGSREKVSVTTRSGHQVVLDNGARTVTVRHSGGATITLSDTGVQIHTTGNVDVTAGLVNVHSSVSTFDGVVKCTTVMADAFVISPGYTPGAGNIL